MNKRGFTIVELIAVIIILGILMLIAVPIMIQHVDDAKKQTFVVNVNSLVKTVKVKAALKAKTKCYEPVNTVELEKGKLNGFIGYVYIEVKNGLYDIKVDIADTNNKFAFYNKEFENIGTYSIDEYNTNPTLNSAYTEKCIED